MDVRLLLKLEGPDLSGPFIFPSYQIPSFPLSELPLAARAGLKDRDATLRPSLFARQAKSLRNLARMLNNARGSSAGDRGSVFRCGRGTELRDKRERICWWER
jgi:hypothetical protein